MFDNIGGKIVDWMKWVCIIGWVYVAIGLIGEMITISDAGWQWLETKYGTDSAFWAGLQAVLNAVLAAAGIYVGTWILYAFGQLVEDVHEIRVHGGRTEVTVSMDGEKKTVVAAEKPAVSFGAKWKCSKCGRENPVFRGTCQNCGTDKFNRPGASASSGPMWRCAKCGTENPVSRASCKDCGAYK